VVEAAPLILDILAAQTGKARGEIRALASQGKLTADVLINSLLKSSKDIDEQFGKTSATIGQSVTVLKIISLHWADQHHQCLKELPRLYWW
jgi:phage-related minor tail protein